MSDSARRASPRKPHGRLVLDRQQTAELCGFVDADAVTRLLKDPTFPKPFFPFPKRPRWMRADVERWLRNKARAAQFRDVSMERQSA